jgi:hypothetical protein
MWNWEWVVPPSPLPLKFLVFIAIGTFSAQIRLPIGVTGKIVKTNELEAISRGGMDPKEGNPVVKRQRAEPGMGRSSYEDGE